MLPASKDRVPAHTDEEINVRIRKETEGNVALYGSAGRPAIDRRLEELDREWDIERTLEANAASFGLLGLILGATVSRKWFIFPAVISAFLLQHALQGWCPPVPVLRRLGFRTPDEIDRERYALKALRGDFKDIPAGAGAVEEDEAGRAVRAAEH